MTNLTNIFILALVVASISFTVTTTSMFLWLREAVSTIHKKIEELIHCPYCLGHWVTFIVLFCVPTRFIIEVLKPENIGCRIFNFLFTTFAIMGMVALLHYVMLRAYEPVAKAMMMRELEKLEED
jgi:lipid-A-disaccharide synthase-like uncharacterized protein